MPLPIDIRHNKNLKLSNVLIRVINDNEHVDLVDIVIKMEDYIKSKGQQPIGPLIQRTDTKIIGEEVIVHVELMWKCQEKCREETP